MSCTIKFRKKVGKTIQKGQITVPKEFDSTLDKQLNCPVNFSIDVIYVLPNKTELNGRLYQSANNTTSFYQFYIVNPMDRKMFQKKIESAAHLIFEYDLNNKRLFISC